MVDNTRAFCFVIGLTLLFGTFELVRRRRLRENYAAAWFGMALLFLAFAAFPAVLDGLGREVGASDALLAIVLVVLLLVMLACLQSHVELSSLSKRSLVLAQELALLRRQVEELREPAERPPAAPPGQPTC